MQGRLFVDKLDIKDIHINPKNPRYIKDERFKLLVKNIKEFPKMMKLRPIIIDDEGMILGGNMRYLAIVELGYKEIPEGWVVKASELIEEEKERLRIIEKNQTSSQIEIKKLEKIAKYKRYLELKAEFEK